MNATVPSATPSATPSAMPSVVIPSSGSPQALVNCSMSLFSQRPACSCPDASPGKLDFSDFGGSGLPGSGLPGSGGSGLPGSGGSGLPGSGGSGLPGSGGSGLPGSGLPGSGFGFWLWIPFTLDSLDYFVVTLKSHLL